MANEKYMSEITIRELGQSYAYDVRPLGSGSFGSVHKCHKGESKLLPTLVNNTEK